MKTKKNHLFEESEDTENIYPSPSMSEEKVVKVKKETY